MKKLRQLLCISILILSACNEKKGSSNEVITSDTIHEIENQKEQLSKADQIIYETIEAHGGLLFDVANYSFTFRDKQYHFMNYSDGYTYSSQIKKKDTVIKDIITNGEFERYKNGILQNNTEEEIKKYTGALNSVIYFATLPHKLKDSSVKKKYIEETKIKGKEYDVIEITFNEDGGGQDYDDEFHYWINKNTKKIDYLAYNYQVNNGGVRFRVAYNSREIDGITFQDYVNYEAQLNTPLKDLPKLYENGELKEISKIETENISKNTNTK
ncbi:hypothetical protein LXD69_01820 [Flavobacterium sediminilitoris]|uniref:Deoxyribose-phosphate aldolase n=1 Tax=Flavobacterium sediminilitoris TaxID=2024526 RepID=A0ABY4HNV5_9FLAO|nr:MULTISPECIES: DUF6503 family protein [Flavobacterium]UOX34265.1 hypothetical protein LXD69_01820 [Flavobacterium sediminilitoris]